MGKDTSPAHGLGALADKERQPGMRYIQMGPVQQGRLEPVKGKQVSEAAGGSVAGCRVDEKQLRALPMEQG